MRHKVYAQKTATYWKTVVVQTKYVLRNAYLEIPSGTKCRITDKRGGFTLKTDPCKYCGVSIFIRHVEPDAVEIVS